jgi:putative transposase
MRRLRLRSRRLNRKLIAAKRALGVFGPIPKGTRLPVSRNRKRAARALARLHARISAVRHDFTHKLTTRLCRENQTVVIENLNVSGMLCARGLSRAVCDVGFSRIRAQLEYKAKLHGTQLIVADRWFPSSKLCSVCRWKNENLTLKVRFWTCTQCGAFHDRDHNAAINLLRIASGAATQCYSEIALPMASLTATSGAALACCPV